MDDVEASLDRILIAVHKELLFVPWRPWAFYLVNDRDVPIDEARLAQVGYGWGGHGSEARGVAQRIGRLRPRSLRRFWRKDSDGTEVNPGWCSR